MPKARYRIMTDYMPKVGTRGLDMMYRTATVQVNLDYGSEADMVKKLRVSLALQPIATALFANSPFTDGKPNGFLSARSEIWRDTDSDRAGMIPFVFEDGFGYERYVDWALDVPMYFIKRGDDLSRRRGLVLPRPARRPASGAARRDRDALRLGEPRLDPVSGGAPQALPRNARRRCRAAGAHRRALGLLDRASLRFGRPRRRLGARAKVERRGSRAPARRRPEARVERRGGGPAVQDVARDALALSHAGLAARGQRMPPERTRPCFSLRSKKSLDSKRTPAERLLELYHGSWGRSVIPAFRECTF